MVLETGLAIAAIVTAVAGTFATYKGQQAQNEAQEKARKFDNRKAQIENARRARRAVAERRMMQAELIQNTETMGARNSSSTLGQVGSLQTQTAANIGAANTQLAGDWGINHALTMGARTAAKWDTVAGGFNAASTVFSTPGFGDSMRVKGTATATPATGQEQLNHFINNNRKYW